MSDPPTISSSNGRNIYRVTMTTSLLGAILAGVWWAAGFTQEVRTMQSEIKINKTFSDSMGRDVFSLRERAAADDATGRATQQRLNSIDRTLQRIETKIDNATRRSNE